MLNRHHFRSSSDICKTFIQTFLRENDIHNSLCFMTSQLKYETGLDFFEQLWLSHIYVCGKVKHSYQLAGVNFCIRGIFDWIWSYEQWHSEVRRDTSEARRWSLGSVSWCQMSEAQWATWKLHVSCQQRRLLLLTSVSLGTNWSLLNVTRCGCCGRVSLQDTPARTTHDSLKQRCNIWLLFIVSCTYRNNYCLIYLFISIDT